MGEGISGNGQPLGDSVDCSLIEYSSLLNDGDAVLDLGMGEGRNAHYFAAKGHPVTGVDYSSSAVRRCEEIGVETGVAMETIVDDITQFPVPSSSYSLIIISNVLNFFHPDEIDQIIQKAISGLVVGGMIYIQAFNRNDPAYARNVKKAEKVDEGTFYRERNDTYIHFFTLDSLLDYFKGFEVLVVTESYNWILHTESPIILASLRCWSGSKQDERTNPLREGPGCCCGSMGNGRRISGDHLDWHEFAYLGMACCCTRSLCKAPGHSISSSLARVN